GGIAGAHEPAARPAGSPRTPRGRVSLARRSMAKPDPARALTAAVSAGASGVGRARQWAEMFSAVGRDADQPELRKWGKRLLDGIQDTDLTSYFSCLINQAQLEAGSVRIALRWRARYHTEAGRYERGTRRPHARDRN